jgi:hypothetical protein
MGAVLLVLTACSARAGVVVLEEGLDGYTGFEDTSIYEERTDNAGGGLVGLFSGTTAQGDLRRALIKADFSSIPPGTPVLSARLELKVTRSSGFAGAYDFTVHRVLSDWGEGAVSDPDFSAGGTGGPAEVGDATWLSNFHTLSLWTTAGGDFSETASGIGPAGLENTVASFTGETMAADVENWIADGSQNFGWILISTIEGTLQRAKRFASSEEGSGRPRIVLLLDEGEDIDGNRLIDATDVQLMINGALGLDIGNLDADVNGDASVNAIDVQLVINGALG